MSSFLDVAEGFEEGQANKRPECVSTKHLQYLDDLRESGDVNMFGARSWLMEEFPELSRKDAATVLSYWMKSFGKDDR